MDKEIDYEEVLRLSKELHELIEFEFMDDAVDYSMTAMNLIRAGYKKVSE